MQVHFLVSPLSLTYAPDAAAHISAYPRAVRKTMHLSPSKPRYAASTAPLAHIPPLTASIASWSSTASFPGDTLILAANTVDPDMDIDSSQEFSDIDDEFAGLTIHTPEQGNIRRWLKGYEVL